MIIDKGFFVMLNHPICQPLIMNEAADGLSDPSVAYFETYALAKESAETNDLGCTFGYEIFQLGCGE